MFVLMLAGVFVGLQAQDVITLRTGEDINAKVTKVGETEIEYKKYENLDGPTYTKKVSDIFSIKYQNGQKEVFNTSPKSSDSQSSVKTGINAGVMEYSRGNLLLNGRPITNSEVSQCCGVDGWNTFKSAQGQRVAGSLVAAFGWGFLGASAGLFAASLIVSSSSTSDVLATWGLRALVPSQILLPVGFVLSGIGNGRLKWLVEDYNSRNNVSENFDIIVSPTIMRVDEFGFGQQYRLGAALTLHF